MNSKILLSSMKLDFNDHSIPDLSPPPSARCHQNSRTDFDTTPPLSRSSSPTRASNFLPFFNSSRSSSPKRVAPREAAEFDASRTIETLQTNKLSGTVDKLTSWFEGASDPVNISLVPSPRKEVQDPFCQAEASETIFSGSSDSVDSFTKRPKRERPMMTPSANSSKFNFFRRPSTVQLKSDPDYLINLDIRDALFPDGIPEEVSSTIFKDLQLNAEGLLRKFQITHIENLAALKAITLEKNIQADELEAAQTRNDHLKMQLLDMAERASEQEKTIAALKAQSQAREAQYVAEKSIRMVPEEDSSRSASSHFHRTRSSDASTLASDSESESDTLDSAVSVFSDTESIRTPGTSVGMPSPTMKHAQLHTTRVHHQPHIQQHQVTHVLVECQNCHGMAPSEAWEVLGIMKMESTALKERVCELEYANEHALDLLNALSLS